MRSVAIVLLVLVGCASRQLARDRENYIDACALRYPEKGKFDCAEEFDANPEKARREGLDRMPDGSEFDPAGDSIAPPPGPY